MTTVHPSKSKETIIEPATPAPSGPSEARPQDGQHLDHPDLSALAETPSTKRRGWLWLVLALVIVGVGGFVLWRFNPLGTKSTGKEGAGARPRPVVASAVTRGDVNLYLSGLLGTVTAFQTVTVRTRVDGEITKVYYTEGQMIKAGEPLVEIDPRPYQVQLAQAEGQLARDKASLTQGRQDLTRDVELLKTKSVTPQAYDAQISTVGQYVGAVKTDEAMIANAKLQ